MIAFKMLMAFGCLQNARQEGQVESNSQALVQLVMAPHIYMRTRTSTSHLESIIIHRLLALESRGMGLASKPQHHTKCPQNLSTNPPILSTQRCCRQCGLSDRSTHGKGELRVSYETHCREE